MTDQNAHSTTDARMSVALPPGAAPTEIGPLLARIHNDARQSGARVVSVDLRGAGPLGIAGLQHFVAWLLEIQDLPRAERYAVHFIGDSGDHYQKRGLEALRACAEDAITIAFVEGNA
jgi:hypothetical protein